MIQPHSQASVLRQVLNCAGPVLQDPRRLRTYKFHPLLQAHHLLLLKRLRQLRKNHQRSDLDFVDRPSPASKPLTMSLTQIPFPRSSQTMATYLKMPQYNRRTALLAFAMTASRR
jgi:hypothetical protein